MNHVKTFAESVPTHFNFGQLHSILAQQAQTEISPVCAVVGGMVAQEVLSSISSKEVNVNNFFCYSAFDGAGSVVLSS
jgi:ubiquitin-like 1-activating enzyme E1 A